MPELPSDAAAGSGASLDRPVLSAPDLPVDVCISYADGAGRSKQLFRSSRSLIETLVEWKLRGHSDILLTWGRTSLAERQEVERQITAAGVAYRVPDSAQPRKSHRQRLKLILAALTALAILAFVSLRLTRFLLNVGEGITKDDAERRAQQNQRMMAAASQAMKMRTFRDLDDPDPETRLKSIALIGQWYSTDQQSIPALVGRLKDSDKTIRLAAILVLGKIGTKSDEAAAGLRGCLADEDMGVRQAAVDVLDKLR